jgi:cupin 2 domain-containing protein
MQVRNLFADAPDNSREEIIDELLRGGTFKLERIISNGQATPPGQWYDQAQEEWVILLSGGARLRFAESDETIQLQPGDYLDIPAHARHRVEWTDPKQKTVWLALHYEAD